jgi:hypothetical protein
VIFDHSFLSVSLLLGVSNDALFLWDVLLEYIHGKEPHCVLWMMMIVNIGASKVVVGFDVITGTTADTGGCIVMDGTETPVAVRSDHF